MKSASEALHGERAKAAKDRARRKAVERVDYRERFTEDGSHDQRLLSDEWSQTSVGMMYVDGIFAIFASARTAAFRRRLTFPALSSYGKDLEDGTTRILSFYSRKL